MATRDDLDNIIRAYVAADEDTTEGELVSNWAVVVVTSTTEGGSGLSVITLGGQIPYWQIKGMLVHALDVVRDTAAAACDNDE